MDQFRDDDQEPRPLPKAADVVVPWEAEDESADQPDRQGRRERHNAFNGAKKRKYLKALAKTGCILDACRAAGVSNTTVYNHYYSDAEFKRHCDLALSMAATNVELLAWERGVEGIEEDVIQYGKVVGTRLKRSDSVLRLLLQGANRKKYGPRPGFTRKRLLKHERDEIERSVRAEIAAKQPSFDDAIEMLEHKLKIFGARHDEERRAAGWVETGDGHWIPPGWVKADQLDGDVQVAGPAPDGEPGNVSDSVSKS